MNEKNMHPYQHHCVEHIIKNPASGLFISMGLGKTVATLTAINRLIYDLFDVSKVLVIAPKFVALQTWSTECAKWDHLKHLRLSKILGTETQRKNALRVKADIYIINRENVAWLVAQYGTAFPFDCVVIDESSSFKSAKAARFKALRQVLPNVSRRVILTGTPVPNGLLDLWPQIYLLDQGGRLGKTITSYRERYFTPGKSNGHVVYEYKLRQGDDLLGKGYYQQEIYDKISDICISMKAEDYLTLPGRIERNVEIKFPPKVQQQYQDFERKQILALEDLEEISAVNAAALTNKLLQFANGAVYNSEKEWYEVHKEKLEALEEIIESSNGHPVLIFYSYKHDLERITKHLKAYNPQQLKTAEDIASWNRKEIPVLMAHPASAGHGLNLQAGGNTIVWFGLPWSLELYMQANTRLDRQGQEFIVIIHRLIAKGTMDEDVIAALENKAGGQEALLQAVKVRILKYKELKTA